jgi:hypothetical protein
MNTKINCKHEPVKTPKPRAKTPKDGWRSITQLMMDNMYKDDERAGMKNILCVLAMLLSTLKIKPVQMKGNIRYDSCTAILLFSKLYNNLRRGRERKISINTTITAKIMVMVISELQNLNSSFGSLIFINSGTMLARRAPEKSETNIVGMESTARKMSISAPAPIYSARVIPLIKFKRRNIVFANRILSVAWTIPLSYLLVFTFTILQYRLLVTWMKVMIKHL